MFSFLLFFCFFLFSSLCMFQAYIVKMTQTKLMCVWNQVWIVAGVQPDSND